MMSVWEQRTTQIRKHMQASSEALYNEELSPRLTSTQHLRPDITTHLDRPLVVELRCDWDKPRDLRVEAGTPEDPNPQRPPDPLSMEPPQSQPPRKHHHRRRERTSNEGRENGETGASRHHVHHSRSKETEGTRAKDVKSERSHSRDARGEHRHHRSHRAGREGNGVVGNKSERHSHHREGSRSARGDGERSSRGEEGGNGGRRRHRQRAGKVQSSLEGGEQRENGEQEESNPPGHRLFLYHFLYPSKLSFSKQTIILFISSQRCIANLQFG